MRQLGDVDRADLPLAVIVGAGALGAAVSRRLGQSHRLLIADRDDAHVNHVSATLRDEGYDVRAIASDITRPSDVGRLVERAAAAGPVQALANVVGLSIAATNFHAILNVNIVGAARIASAFANVLAHGGCGVFISSSSAHMGAISDDIQHLLEDPLRDDFIAALEARLGKPESNAANAYMLSKAALNRMCVRLAPA